MPAYRGQKGIGAVAMLLLLMAMSGGGLVVGSSLQSMIGVATPKQQVLVARAAPQTDFSF